MQQGAAGRQVTAGVRAAGVVSAVVWAGVALVWHDGPFALTFDDAYYYVEIARRIADGGGSTFDGLNTTNGYHPLWMLVCTIPFLLGLTGLAAVRVLLAVQAVLWGAGWWFLGGILGRSVDGWPKLAAKGRQAAGRPLPWVIGGFAFVLAVTPEVTRVVVNGMESALVWVVGAVLLDAASRGSGRLVEGRSSRWRWTFGAVLAVAVLARTDHVLLVAVVAVAVLFEGRGGRSLVDQVRATVPLLLPPAVTTAVFIAFNLVLVGIPLQISGDIKRAEIHAGNALVALVAGGVGLVLLRAAGRAGPARRMVRTKRLATTTSWYGVFCLGLLVYYTQLQAQIWLWYFAPLLVWGVVLLLTFLLDACEAGLVDAPEGRRPMAAVAPLVGVLGVPLLVGCGFLWTSFVDPDIRSIQVTNAQAGKAISRDLPPDAVLASWDAGALGFFADQPVVNLDGVVNSPEWFQATKDGPEAVRRFLDGEGVRYIVNHGEVIDGNDPSILEFVKTVYGPERAAGTELVASFPFTYSGSTVGSGGRGGGGHLAVFVYRIPPP